MRIITDFDESGGTALLYSLALPHQVLTCACSSGAACATAALSLALPHQAKHVQEQPHNVQVDVQCSEDVVVHCELVRLVLAADDELRVVDDVPHEDQDANQVIEHDAPCDWHAECPEHKQGEAPADERE